MDLALNIRSMDLALEIRGMDLNSPFSYLSKENYVVATHLKHLIEMLQMSNHNKSFYLEIWPFCDKEKLYFF